MKGSKNFIAQDLSILRDNIQKTGDPLGIKTVYWTEWAKGLNLPRESETVIFTSRMYQMLPYLSQTTSLIAWAKPFLSRAALGNVISIGNRLMGSLIIRLRASKAQKCRSTRALRGVVTALIATGCKPAYLYEDEPYSGALLYDLGLDEALGEHISKVYNTLKRHGVKEVIGVDPHTVFMLKEVYPKYIDNYVLEVKHYSYILLENSDKLGEIQKRRLEGKFVIHDPCFMARNLGIVEQPRRLLESLGVTVLEPENTKLNTFCCGGPIEYAFPEMTEKVSRMRIEELAKVSKNMVVTCPICFLNLNKYEQELGVKVLDLGELLYKVVATSET